MQEVAPDARTALAPLFAVDRPGPQNGHHAIATGTGRCWVDRLPGPRVAVVQTGMDVAIAGDPDALGVDALRSLGLVGFIDADDAFLPTLRGAFPDLTPWERVVLRVAAPTPLPAPAVDCELRRIDAGDAAALAGLDPDNRWITLPWDGAARTAGSGLAWGAFVSGALASVALPFTMGPRCEDLGVVTEPDWRRRGLSTACAARVVRDVHERGRIASWTTGRDNAASLGVARNLGGEPVRRYTLQVTGVPLPAASA